MKKFNSIAFALLLLSTVSCQVVGDIFGAGFYTGIFMVVLVVAIIIFVVAKMSRRR